MQDTRSAWLLLAASIVVEVAGTTALKHSNGFSKLWPSLVCLACYGMAVWWMSISMQRLGMGTTYAVWAACGTALTAVIGVWLYQESITPIKLLGLALVIAGVACIHLGSQQT